MIKGANMFNILYRYFADPVSDLSEEDRHIIDKLYQHLSGEIQIRIRKYLLKEYAPHEIQYKRASSNLQCLKVEFKNYKEILKAKGQLYDYFRIIDSNLTDIDYQVIDTLFGCLPYDRQEGILKYIKKKSKNYVGKRALNDLQILQEQFRDYKRNCLEKRKKLLVVLKQILNQKKEEQILQR